MNPKTNSQVFQSKIQEIKSIEVKSDNTHNSNKKELNSNKEINEIKENNNQEKIYVIINKNTEKLMDSKKKTDLIQCALEYNSYLIENLIKEKDNLNKIQYDCALNRLYDNLKILTQSFESYEDKYKLINTKSKENKENKDINKKNDKNGNEDGDINNNTDRIYCNSITNIEMELPL